MKLFFLHAAFLFILFATCMDANDFDTLVYDKDSDFVTTVIKVKHADTACIDPKDGGRGDLLFFYDEAGVFAINAPDSTLLDQQTAVFGVNALKASVPGAVVYRLDRNLTKTFSKKDISLLQPDAAENDSDVRKALAQAQQYTPLELRPCPGDRHCAFVSQSAYFISVNTCRTDADEYAIDLINLSLPLARLEKDVRTYNDQDALTISHPRLLGHLIEADAFSDAIANARSATELQAVTRMANQFGQRDERLTHAVALRRDAIAFDASLAQMNAPENTYRDIIFFINACVDKNLTAAQKNALGTLAQKAYELQRKEALNSGDIEKIRRLLHTYPDQAAENLTQAQQGYRARGDSTAESRYYALSYRLKANPGDRDTFIETAADAELANASFLSPEDRKIAAAALAARQQKKRVAAAKAAPTVKEAVPESLSFTEGVFTVTWQDDASSAALKLSWDDAVAYCAQCKLEGHKDWELPDPHDLTVLFHKRTKITHATASNYWSGQQKFNNKTMAYFVDFTTGYRSAGEKSEQHYVRCFRKNRR